MGRADAIGSLNLSNARFVGSYAAEMASKLPKPEYEWSYDDITLDWSFFFELQERGLIDREIREAGTWRTPRRTISAIADYGGYDEQDVGVDLPVDPAAVPYPRSAPPGFRRDENRILRVIVDPRDGEDAFTDIGDALRAVDAGMSYREATVSLSMSRYSLARINRDQVRRRLYLDRESDKPRIAAALQDSGLL